MRGRKKRIIMKKKRRRLPDVLGLKGLRMRGAIIPLSQSSPWRDA
jgi:hypothetical protein